MEYPESSDGYGYHGDRISNMFRSDIVNFPVYLIIGQTLYNFMSESTTQAIFSIIGNASLLKKPMCRNMYLPYLKLQVPL